MCTFQLMSLWAGLGVKDEQIISINIIRWQEADCKRTARSAGIKAEETSKSFNYQFSCFVLVSLIDFMCLCMYAGCCIHMTVYQIVGVFECVCSLYPSCQCVIDLDGPVGIVLTEDTDTREPAIRQTQPAHYPWAHDNSCLVPPQGQGCSCSHYVMKRRGREQRREGPFTGV